MASRKLRIVALHGYTSNSFMFQRRCGALRKACKAEADFVFLDGPHLVQPITAAQSLDAPDSQGVVTEDTPLEEQPRAWWKASDDGAYEGWQETAEFLSEQMLRFGPFDGVLGFSQGACLAGVLAAAIEHPDIMPSLRFHPDQTRLKICIAVGGFLPRDPRLSSVFASPIETAVLHILGDKDYIVTRERSQTLVDACSNSRTEVHPGGHTLPSQAPWRGFFQRLLQTFAEDRDASWQTVQGPGEISSTTDEGSRDHVHDEHDGKVRL